MLVDASWRHGVSIFATHQAILSYAPTAQSASTVIGALGINHIHRNELIRTLHVRLYIFFRVAWNRSVEFSLPLTSSTNFDK